MKKIDKTETLKTILLRSSFEVDYYQREYRWGRVQIEQMINDFYANPAGASPGSDIMEVSTE